jgi:tetratricopeptide (TPR) repeat protein
MRLYCWLACRQGKAKEALARLDPWLAQVPLRVDGKPVSVPEYHVVLHLEKVHVLIALNEWQAAEEYLAEILQVPNGLFFDDSANAWLLQGFFHERRGEMDKAQAAWKRGVFHPRKGETLNLRDLRIPGLILGSLTKEMTEADAELYMQSLIDLASGISPTAGVLKLVKFPPAVLRNAWTTRRGMEWARKLALRDLSLSEQVRAPVFVVLLEWQRQGAFAGPLIAEQEEVLWQLNENIVQRYVEKKLSTAEMFQVLQSWRGTTNFLGWSGLAPSLDPAVRGPLAYVLGHRFQRLGQPPERAAEFFRTALKDAAPDSVLHRLAQADLKRLQTK